MTETSIKAAPTEDRLKRQRDFTDAVRGWYEDDKSRLAILRRCAGGTLTQAIAEGQRVTWMYRLFTQFPEFQEESLLLTATLLAFDRGYLEGSTPPAGSLGRTMSRLKGLPGVSEQSVERRFAILLDADYDGLTGAGELPYRLRQTVKYVLSKKEQIDWPQLLEDVRWWNGPQKRVQKCWAKDFYAPALKTEETQTEEDTKTQGDTDAD